MSQEAIPGAGSGGRPGDTWTAPTRRGLLGSGAGLGASALLALAAGPMDVAMAAAAGARASRIDELPPVFPRRAWNAGAPRLRAEVLDRGPDHLVVHHTSTPNTSDLSLTHACDLSRRIQRFHMRTRGWNDIGEQLTISRGGFVMEGRNGSLKAILSGRNVMGAQTQGHNQHTLGIENEGNYMRAPVPDFLWSALTEVCVWLCRTYALNPFRAIVGHRDFNATDCPGDVLYARLPELRRTVADRLFAAELPNTVPDPAFPDLTSGGVPAPQDGGLPPLLPPSWKVIQARPQRRR